MTKIEFMCRFGDLLDEAGFDTSNDRVKEWGPMWSFVRNWVRDLEDWDE